MRDYLYPEEIVKSGTPVKGAILLDMLLEYDTERNSQKTDDLGVSVDIIPLWLCISLNRAFSSNSH